MAFRNAPKAIHGWKDGDKFYTSLRPKADKSAANQHDTAQDALREASRRHLPIIWDDPGVID